MLWHGTGDTPPKCIYEGEVGFDMTYANFHGYWGHAIYFAKNAMYSNDYRHNLANGDRQIFLADVLLGKYQLSPQDKKLRMPPVNPAAKRQGDRFDSVKGNTNGSDVYMVYQTH